MTPVSLTTTGQLKWHRSDWQMELKQDRR